MAGVFPRPPARRQGPRGTCEKRHGPRVTLTVRIFGAGLARKIIQAVSAPMVLSGREIAVSATRPDGSTTSFQATIRVDTPQELRYVEHGGILPFVLRQLIAKA